MIKRVIRKIEAMSQKKFDRYMFSLMYLVMFGILLAIIFNIPEALDQMWYEQYELPVESAEKIKNK
jgi:nitrate/nitrite transporter NarK